MKYSEDVIVANSQFYRLFHNLEEQLEAKKVGIPIVTIQKINKHPKCC
jgi:hypothetical protein